MKQRKTVWTMFGCGMVLALISMVLGPFGAEEGALTCGIAAAVLGLVGMVLVFRDWKEPPPQKDKNKHPPF